MQNTDIIIKGNASVSNKPDCISLSIELKANAFDYGTTVETLNDAVSQALKAMLAIGVDEEPVTDKYSVDESWSNPYHDDTKTRTFLGYEGEQRLRVRMPLDMEMLGEALKLLSSQKIKPSVTTNFEVRDPTKMQAEARQKAIQAAKLAANDIATQLGLNIVGVKSVRYDMPFGSNRSRLDIDMDDMVHGMSSGPARASFTPNINPSDIQSHDDIVIIWECAG